MINNSLYNKKKQIWSLRLSVRTRGFHPRKRGSIPLGTAIFRNMTFYVYMLQAINKKISKTYVGYTNDLNNRLKKHNSNKGAKSTKGYKWSIIYKKRFFTKNDAMSYEYKLKNDRKKRLSIIKKCNDKKIKNSNNSSL